MARPGDAAPRSSARNPVALRRIGFWSMPVRIEAVDSAVADEDADNAPETKVRRVNFISSRVDMVSPLHLSPADQKLILVAN